MEIGDLIEYKEVDHSAAKARLRVVFGCVSGFAFGLLTLCRAVLGCESS